MLALDCKSEPIKFLVNRLLEKYGEANILVANYWDSDNSAIGLVDKTKKLTVYISDYGQNENKYFVSLENPDDTGEMIYSPGGDFANQTFKQTEKLIVKHLRIS